MKTFMNSNPSVSRMILTALIASSTLSTACSKDGSAGSTPVGATAVSATPAPPAPSIPEIDQVTPVESMPSIGLTTEKHSKKECPRGIDSRAWVYLNSTRGSWERAFYRFEGERLIETFAKTPVIYDGQIREYKRPLRNGFTRGMRLWYVAYCRIHARNRELHTKIWGTDGSATISIHQIGKIRDGRLETIYEYDGQPQADVIRWELAY